MIQVKFSGIIIPSVGGSNVLPYAVESHKLQKRATYWLSLVTSKSCSKMGCARYRLSTLEPYVNTSIATMRGSKNIKNTQIADKEGRGKW